MDTRKFVLASHGLKARLKASFSVGALSGLGTGDGRMDPETDPPAPVANLEESAHKVQGIAKTGMRTSHGDDVGQHPQRELAHCKLSGPSGHAEERFSESSRLGLAQSCS